MLWGTAKPVPASDAKRLPARPHQLPPPTKTYTAQEVDEQLHSLHTKLDKTKRHFDEISHSIDQERGQLSTSLINFKWEIDEELRSVKKQHKHKVEALETDCETSAEKLAALEPTVTQLQNHQQTVTVTVSTVLLRNTELQKLVNEQQKEIAALKAGMTKRPYQSPQAAPESPAVREAVKMLTWEATAQKQQAELAQLLQSARQDRGNVSQSLASFQQEIKALSTAKSAPADFKATVLLHLRQMRQALLGDQKSLLVTLQGWSMNKLDNRPFSRADALLKDLSVLLAESHKQNATRLSKRFDTVEDEIQAWAEKTQAAGVNT